MKGFFNGCVETPDPRVATWIHTVQLHVADLQLCPAPNLKDGTGPGAADAMHKHPKATTFS